MKRANRKPSDRTPANDNGPSLPLPAHIPGQPESESGQPGGGAGRIEITGIVPDAIEVDPDLTEGHPGYEESGDSGLSASNRPTKS
jgi:hypothetical protein